MLPPPTTIATSTPRPCVVATSAAIALTHSGSVPYSSSPISASPESFSRIRRKTGGAIFDDAGVSAADGKPGKATHHDVLAGLGGQLGAQLLDRLAAVLLLVDVLLAQKDDIVEPLVELARDDPLTDVLRPVGRLLDRDSLLALAVLGRDLVVGDGE